jgi:alpha-beta hydrolase superfamily lysophospholipase
MTVEEGRFTGAGGVDLHWRRVAPAGAPRGVVLVVHGYAEHLGRYAELLAHLAGRGLAVAALDLRGHGRSGGPRGHCLDFTEYVADVAHLAAAAESWWPGRRRVLFAHSMGGLVALLFLLRHPDAVRAAALSAPALRLPDGGPRVLRALGAAIGRVAPGIGFRSSVEPAALARDARVGEAYVADPLVHRRASAGFARAFAAAQATAEAAASEIRVPLLVLQGAADRIVDPAGARDLAARLTCPHELMTLPGYFHELLNEPPAERAAVLAALDRWVDRWLAAG